MRTIPILLIGLCLSIAGCASRQSGPIIPGQNPDINIAGVYQYSTVLNRGGSSDLNGALLSESVNGEIRIQEQNGLYTGTITISGRSAMPITSVIVGRRDATIQTRDSNGDTVVLRLVFQGDAFSGQWIDENGRSSPVRGTRRQ